jgi:hypothetical protein
MIQEANRNILFRHGQGAKHLRTILHSLLAIHIYSSLKIAAAGKRLWKWELRQA